jgi:hypothetical protein
MTYPFSGNAVVSDDFNGHVSGRKNHNAWDVADVEAATILAPEDGVHFSLFMLRSDKDVKKDHGTLPPEIRPYSWYFADRYGLCSILLAKDRWWLFAHCPVGEIGDMTKWRDNHNPAKFVECYSRNYGPVTEGEALSRIGDTGFSTGPHCHMEITTPGYPGGYTGRLDPAKFWPDADMASPA